jgi:hypothetical protein
LDSAWAVRPIDLLEQSGCPTLVLEDPGGETLDRSLPGPVELTRFLRLAIRLATALSDARRSLTLAWFASDLSFKVRQIE